MRRTIGNIMDISIDENEYVHILDSNRKIGTETAYWAEHNPLSVRMHCVLITNHSTCNHWIMRNKTNLSNNYTNSDTVTEEKTSDKENLRSSESILNEQHEVLQSNVELRISFLESVVGNLVANGSCIEKIGRILFEAECRLSDLVYLKNVNLTRAFLREQESMKNQDSDENDSLNVNDLRISVDRVMSFFDVEHTEVLLISGPNKKIKIQRFFSNLVSMSRQHPNLKALKLFIEPIVKWNILDEETCMFIEQEIFFKADKKVIQILLQCGLHDHINKLFGSNVSAALFGNPNVKIGYLKRKKEFNVNVRGTANSTALHYATKSKSFKKIKYLLDRGVDPNTMTSKFVTAFNLAISEPNANAIENEKCVELLLQYGADPFLLCSHWMMSECCILVNSYKPPRSKYISIGHLSKLVFAYICMYEAAGMKNVSFHLRHHHFDEEISLWQMKNDMDLREFRGKCRRELEILKEFKIRDNITMFRILFETGRKLFRLLNTEECKIIMKFINSHSKEKTLNCYYLNTLREHVRQVKKLVAHKDRAMFVISTCNNILSPFPILDRIVSYLSYEDLLMFAA